MSREMLMRMARRAAVFAGTIAVIGVAVGTVQVAAEWRAAAAPLDTAPVSLSSIEQDYAIESERAEDLTTQMNGVAGQISSLQSALIAANGSIATDAASATKLQDQLVAAKAKLTSIQKQLKGAQDRLGALNRAAARQAAANRSSKSSSGGGGGGGGSHEDDDDDDDHGEGEDDD
jgi:septal ring factor EnvC (AmiA/AmiB activator)